MKRRKNIKVRLLGFSLAFALCFTTVFSLSVLTGYEYLVFAKKVLSATVTNQSELNKALRDSAVKDIKIKSDDEKIKIKKGSYSGVKLTINAAKANIINKGSDFDQIVIKSASSFTEMGDNNNIVSKAGKIKITVKKASDNLKLIIAKKNSNVDVKAGGRISVLRVTKPGNTTKLAVVGTVGQADVQAASTLIMTGEVDAKNAIAVNMTANRAVLWSEIPANVGVFAKVDVEFAKGASGSTVTTKKDGAVANVTNNSEGKVELIGKTGSKVLEPGETAKVKDAVTEKAVSDNKAQTVTGNTVTGNAVTGNSVSGNGSKDGGSGSSGGGSSGGGSSGGSSSGGGSSGGSGGSSGGSSGGGSSDNVVTNNSVTSNAVKISPETINNSSLVYEKTYIKMGEYEGEPLEWEVLDTSDEKKALVISRRIITESDLSSLDDTLNTLYTSACGFTDDEKTKISDFFILTEDEISIYYKRSIQQTSEHKYSQHLLAEGTLSAVNNYVGKFASISQSDYEYALKPYFYTSDCVLTSEDLLKGDSRYKKYGSWWLGGGNSSIAYYVDGYGDVRSTTAPAESTFGVRPAMLIAKDSDYEYETYNLDPSYVTFGKYAYSLDESNDPVTTDLEWEIIDEDDNGILLLCKDIIDCKKYNGDESVWTRWKGSTINKWLNEDSDGFYYNAFTSDDSARIATVQIQDEANKYNDAGGGDACDCSVFILSLQDIEKYFGIDYRDDENKRIYSDDLICSATTYAKYNCENAGSYGGMLSHTIDSVVYNSAYKEIYKYGDGETQKCVDKEGSQWFVRTAADSGANVCYVDCDGSIKLTQGVSVEMFYGVRPAIYVKRFTL